jgi:hypothetical protein
MTGRAETSNDPSAGAAVSGRVCIAILALLAGQAGFHVAWFAQDVRIPFWDQYRYYAMSRTAADIIEGQAPTGIAGVWRLHESHPPLYPLLGVLALKAGGGGFHAARLVNVGLAALTVLATLSFSRRWLSPWGALLAAFFAAAMPLISSLAHLYYIENLLVPWVVLSLDVLVRSDRLRRRRSVVLLGLLAGTGCLVKWTYPVFLALPILWAAWQGREWKGLLWVAGIAGVVALPWYLSHAEGIRDFFAAGVTGGAGHLSAVTGFRGLLYYPKTLLLVATGLPLGITALAGFIILLRRERSSGMILFLAVLVPILVFSFVLTKKPRHILPVLPVVGVMASAAVLSCPRPAAVLWACGLVAHTTIASLHASFAFPAAAAELKVASYRVPILSSKHSDDPGPPDRMVWPYDSLLSQLPVPSGNGTKTPVLVTFNVAGFRDVGFAYAAGERRLPFVFGLLPLHFPEGHPGHSPFPLSAPPAEGALGLLDASVVIAKGGSVGLRVQSGMPVHVDAARVSEALQDPHGPLEAAFQLQSRTDLPDGSSASVFEARRGPDRDRSLARFALRYSPEHEHAWRILGETPPASSGRDARLAEIGVIPEALARARAASARAEDDSARLAIREALAGDPDREDVQIAAVEVLAPEEPLRAVLERMLALREECRVPLSGRRAEMDLAGLHWELGHRGAAVTWLRRALEADRELALSLRLRLEYWGISVSVDADLREALRAREVELRHH